MQALTNRQTSISGAAVWLAVALATAPLAPAASADDCARTGPTDWMDSIPTLLAPHPADCSRVEQSPPDFYWPAVESSARYEFRLDYPDGRHETRMTDRNWIAWHEILPAGEYTWQVALEAADGRTAGQPRRFDVDAASMPFLVPEWTEVRNRASEQARPRALPPDLAALRDSDDTGRRSGLGHLLADVERRLGVPLPRAPQSVPGQAYYRSIDIACRDALNAALAWIATRQSRYLEEAVRRARELASWPPDGQTSYARMDEPARQIAWTLTLLYDWLAADLEPADSNVVLAPLEARVQDIYDDVIVHTDFSARPYDSHRSRTLTHLAAMAVLLVGDVPAADGWLREALPLAVHFTSPWGGEDGGFANGTAYALWDAGGSLLPWYTLRWVAGVDVAAKAWTRNFTAYLAYFVPPGAPTGAFGDGAERSLAENRARFGKALARFVSSPISRWYASQESGEDPARLELLLAPRDSDIDDVSFPPGMPDGKTFPSIGWSAMHSKLADPGRTSIYFKSSPYGSYNHSHADQNSFVINAGGERLAIDSGYYDGYRTPHWNDWYKHSLAHNAITYDGGRGQRVFEQTDEHAPGAITFFEHRRGYDIVNGDATMAYGGDLSRAERTLVYLRPGTILIHDQLASYRPRRWEWNIHALEQIEVDSDRSIRIRAGSARLCIEMLRSPAMQFSQTDEFVAPPGGSQPDQWHGRFTSSRQTARAEFVALLSVGCDAGSAAVEDEDCGPVVEVADTRVRLCGNQTAVE